jgi:hypothetical protein
VPSSLWIWVSVALFDCPRCVDEFRFDYEKIAKLTYGWRVRVRCPGRGNVVQVVMLNYTLIHGCDPDKSVGGALCSGDTQNFTICQ